MTQPTLLLTSFQPWLAHHKSNAADDLLEKIQSQNFIKGRLIFLRDLPVETQTASAKAIAMIEKYQPDFVICCGMAESRDRLTVESQAFWQQEQYQTIVNLEVLLKDLPFTQISHEAGKFVCEGLYFYVLKYIQQSAKKIPTIFVHVPLFSVKNEALILQDFNKILSRLAQNQS